MDMIKLDFEKINVYKKIIDKKRLNFANAVINFETSSFPSLAFSSSLAISSFQVHVKLRIYINQNMFNHFACVCTIHYINNNKNNKKNNNNKINNNIDNWILQRKGIEPTLIPVTSWRASSTLTVDSPWAHVFFTKVVDAELPVIILDTFFHVAQFL